MTPPTVPSLFLREEKASILETIRLFGALAFMFWDP